MSVNLEKKSHIPKIGITLSFPIDMECFFTNGIRQNAVFFYDLLLNIGKYDLYFISDKKSEKVEKYFIENNYKYIYLDSISSVDLNIIISFTFTLPISYLSLIKEKGIKNIFYNCGNFYISDSESCLFGNNKDNFVIYDRFKFFDECWNIPQMENTNHYYLKTLLRCDKVIEVPYIWSPKLIDKKENMYIKRKEKKSIAIFEPNLSIMKWCFPSILICENSYRDSLVTDKIDKVYITNVFNSSNSQFNLNNFNNIVKPLDLKKDNKLSIEHRYNSLYFMSKYADVVVSHTWENYFNYLYFDIAWMGWPIVHNGMFCKEVGYYYDEFNYEMGGNALKEALLNHDNNVDEYIKRNREYIDKYLPTNIELQKKYEELISNTLSS